MKKRNNNLDLYYLHSNAVAYTLKPFYCFGCGGELLAGFQIYEHDFKIFCFQCFYNNLTRFFYEASTPQLTIRLVEFEENKSIKITGSSNNKDNRDGLTPKLRHKVMQRDGFECVFCGDSGKKAKLEIDHIKPVSKNGATVFENLQTLCFKCNRGKSNS